MPQVRYNRTIQSTVEFSENKSPLNSRQQGGSAKIVQFLKCRLTKIHRTKPSTIRGIYTVTSTLRGYIANSFEL